MDTLVDIWLSHWPWLLLALLSVAILGMRWVAARQNGPAPEALGAAEAEATPDVASSLEAGLDRCRRRLDNLDGILVEWDRAGTVLSINDYGQRLLGLAVGARIPSQVLDPPGAAGEAPDPPTRDFFQAVFQSPERYAQQEAVIQTPEGRPVTLAWSHTPLRDAQGQIEAMVSLGLDVTQHRAAAAREAQRLKELEASLETCAQALSIAKEAAQSANRAKNAFLTNMSHELRTPMSGILGMTHLALRRASDPKLIDQLSKIDFSAQHLLNLIDDILDLSRIEAERLELEPKDFTLAEVVDKLRARMGPKAAAKGLDLRMDVPRDLGRDRLRGDPERLGQILLNLVDNAIKFTAAGQVILSVKLASAGADEVRLRFEVADTGIGIAPEHQKRLFQAFEQVDSSMTREYGGSGLGLALCQRLAHMMGSDIGVHSTPGQGSQFWFTARLLRV